MGTGSHLVSGRPGLINQSSQPPILPARLRYRIWQLKIRQVQESDRGCYMCQINTEEMKKQIGCIDVLSECDTDLILSHPPHADTLSPFPGWSCVDSPNFYPAWHRHPVDLLSPSFEVEQLGLASAECKSNSHWKWNSASSSSASVNRFA